MPRADLHSGLRPRIPATDASMFCVSLKMLAVAADASAVGGTLPVVQTCYGLNRVSGYVLDADNRDIIFYGRQDQKYPPIHLADICTFVQNVWHEDRLQYVGDEYPSPSCSLDLGPGAMASVDRVLRETAGSHFDSLRERDRIARRLADALGPQEVRIHGVPRDARVAHVMIDADYHMKMVSQGHATLPGIDSCARIGLNRQKRGEHPTSRMSRFWFHLDRDHPTFLKANGIVEIEDCAMVVLTESQVSADDGSLTDGGDADPVAQTFAECLSDQLRSEVVDVREYRELSNLYRLFALLKAIQFQGADRAAGFDLKPFEGRFSSAGELPSHLPALANIVGDMEETRTAKQFFFSLVCGGVSMETAVSSNRFIEDRSGPAGGKRDAILKSRPDPRCAFWQA